MAMLAFFPGSLKQTKPCLICSVSVFAEGKMKQCRSIPGGKKRRDLPTKTKMIVLFYFWSFGSRALW